MDDPAQAVHFRVRAIGVNDKPTLEPIADKAANPDPIESRKAYCFATSETTTFGVYQRADLGPGDVVAGPAIIQEPTTTIVFHSDQHAEVDEFGHILITQRSNQ